MLQPKLRGLGVALVTPFTENNSVDFFALEKLTDFHIDSGTDYLVILGTTAETPTLSVSEQNEIIRFIVRRVGGRLPIVAGIGGNNTASVVERLGSADLSGVDAILSITPYYNKPTQEGLFRHFMAISEASPVPVVLYNVPGRTGVNMTAETSLRIANACKNVIAVKEASGDLQQMQQIVAGAPSHFSLISGDDTISTAVIEIGGIGVISVFGNAFPKEMRSMVHRALRGEVEEARSQMNASFEELCRLLFIDGNPAGVKCVLSIKGLLKNQLRLPLVPVREEIKILILEELKKIEE